MHFCRRRRAWASSAWTLKLLAAQLAEAQVALQMANLARDQLTVRAPFGGVVVAQGRQIGENARAGEMPVRRGGGAGCDRGNRG